MDSHEPDDESVLSEMLRLQAAYSEAGEELIVFDDPYESYYDEL